MGIIKKRRREKEEQLQTRYLMKSDRVLSYFFKNIHELHEI